jgi:hypothetical protein
MAGESRVTRASITIGNFGEVSPTYYRGEQPEGSEYASLAAFGIKTVIDLQADYQATKKGLVEKAGMAFPPDSDDHAYGADDRADRRVSEAGERSGESAGLRALRGRKASHRRDDARSIG